MLLRTVPERRYTITRGFFWVSCKTRQCWPWDFSFYDGCALEPLTPFALFSKSIFYYTSEFSVWISLPFYSPPQFMIPANPKYPFLCKYLTFWHSDPTGHARLSQYMQRTRGEPLRGASLHGGWVCSSENKSLIFLFKIIDFLEKGRHFHRLNLFICCLLKWVTAHLIAFWINFSWICRHQDNPRRCWANLGL